MVSASLIFQDDKSNKFWNIESNGKTFTTTWGRIGTIGQSQTKTYYDPQRCESEATKLITSKVKKGYVEAITEDLIRETFIMIISGVAEFKSPGEVFYRDDKFKKLATIEFVEGSSDHIIFRQYYENGKKKSEHEWLEGKQNGRDLGWYDSGKKHWERTFAAGKMIQEKKY